VRVLHVSPYFPPAYRYGGPPASVLGLCKGLQRAGVQVEVVTTTANGDARLPASPSGTDYEGVRVRYADAAFPRRFFGARIRTPLAAALAQADVCHVHGMWNVPEWFATHMARGRRIPYVLSPRGMLQPAALDRGRWRKAVAYRLLEARNLRRASMLHATSDQEADALRALALDVPIAVVPNGVDLGAADRAPRGARARLGIPPDAFVVLFLGRLHAIKRLDLLAGAFAAARTTRPFLHLVIAGPDEHRLLPGILESLAGHADAVHAVGAVDGADKWALLKDADVSVQCSDSESFGLSVVESLAAGVPVVATHTCPWRVIEVEGCGRWVEQSTQAIAAAIGEIADDRARAAAMGERAAKFARARYGWDAIARAMTELYASVH